VLENGNVDFLSKFIEILKECQQRNGFPESITDSTYITLRDLGKKLDIHIEYASTKLLASWDDFRCVSKIHYLVEQCAGEHGTKIVSATTIREILKENPGYEGFFTVRPRSHSDAKIAVEHAPEDEPFNESLRFRCRSRMVLLGSRECLKKAHGYCGPGEQTFYFFPRECFLHNSDTTMFKYNVSRQSISIPMNEPLVDVLDL